MKNYLFKIQNYLSKIQSFELKNYILALKKRNPFGTIIALISVIFLILLYFTIPAYYNYENFDNEIKKKVLKDFKIDLKNIKKIRYSILPSPHFIIEECDLYFANDPKEKLILAKKLKINIFSKNLHNKEKIELKNITLNKADLDLQFIDIKNFYIHIKNNINKPIYLNNSNFFFRDQDKEIISISQIKKFEYFFDLQNKEKKINILGNFYGSNFNFKWEKNFSNPYITKSNIRFYNPNINISNNFDKKNENFINSKTKINFLRNNLVLNYKFNKNNIHFIDDSSKKITDSKLVGEVNLNPFFFDLNLILSGLSIDIVLNNLFLNLYKLKKSSHLNFNGNLKINLNDINNRLFENLILNINFIEKKINLNKSSLNLKKIGKINFSDPDIYEKNQKIFVKSKITFDVFDQQELYKRFLIPRQNRIDLKKVYFELEYNIDDRNYYLSDINFTENVEQSKNFYEVNNFQQLNTIVSKEFKKISLD